MNIFSINGFLNPWNVVGNRLLEAWFTTSKNLEKSRCYISINHYFLSIFNRVNVGSYRGLFLDIHLIMKISLYMYILYHSLIHLILSLSGSSYLTNVNYL